MRVTHTICFAYHNGLYCQAGFNRHNSSGQFLLRHARVAWPFAETDEAVPPDELNLEFRQVRTSNRHSKITAS